MDAQDTSDQQSPIVVQVQVVNTNTNEVEVKNAILMTPGATVDDKQALLARFCQAIGQGILWILRNPEWGLKWALILLSLRLFIDQGFSLQTLQRTQTPNIPTTSPPTAPSSP